MPKSILVVDDEVGFRQFVLFLLKPFGYEMQFASNGQMALQWLKQRPFDVVLMDTHMPVLSGPEALSTIRVLYPRQKVILLSSIPGRLAEASAGVMACLIKPVGVDDLLNTLQRALDGPLEEGGRPQ